MSLRSSAIGKSGFQAVLFSFIPLLAAEAQDVDVPGNLTMHDSTDATTGNVLKEGVPFLHNFGAANTFLGGGAGNFNMGGGYNTATGFQALQSNTTGAANTAHGATALFSNTEGDGNTASGSNALRNNTYGRYNTAIGYESLRQNTVGILNTAVGGNALLANRDGSYNTASGFWSLYQNTTGLTNTATGYEALYNNTSGNSNVASGFSALFLNTTGSFNTGVGNSALFSNTVGSTNTGIGNFANVSTGELTNATAIGFGAVVDASNKIRLGNADVTVIEGEVPYTYTSDRNKKENFRPLEAEMVLTKLRGLSVTSWNYIGQDAKQFRHYGPMSQDFFAAFGHDAVGTIGTPTTITSGDLDGVLVIAEQALEHRTEELKGENAQLRAKLEALERRIGNCGLSQAE